jgi:hypothetical protein
MNWDLTAMSHRKRLLARLIAAHVVLFGAATVNATWAEDAAPGSNQRDVLPGSDGAGSAAHGGILNTKASGGGVSGEGDAGPKENEKTKVDENAADKVDSSNGNTGERHTGSTGSSKGAEETESKGGWHGQDHAGTKPSGTDLGPIDIRITVLGKPRFGHSKAYGWKKSKVVRPSGNSRDGRRTWTRAKNGVVRNAIGVPVRQGSSDTRGADKGFEHAVGGSPKNANPPENGGTEAVGTDFHGQEFVPLRASAARTQGLPINTALNRSMINGTGMGRAGAGAGVIGSAAKNVAGISGTSFRPRHP